MIGWNATVRSLAVVTAGAVVSFCGVKMLTCTHGQRSDAAVMSAQKASVHGCRQAKRKALAAKAHALEVDVAEFGVQSFSEDGEFAFEKTDKIALEPGVTFGWRLHLKGNHEEHVAHSRTQNGTHAAAKTVRVKEVFVLPQAPARWGIGPQTKLSHDLTQATTRDRVDLAASNGWLSSAWTVSAGDPPGRYKMLVYLDDQLVKTFEFDVEAPQD